SHPDYVGNPLVYAGTVGIMPHWAATKSVQPGDRIVVVGGRTGRDGIHGATFSSVELTETSEIESSAAVQIGDAITEKRVLDLIVRARDARLYRGITDCGAGGLSSAVGEMGAECGAAERRDSVP
ncbi:MAG: AIR synthase-related protein, partial [bacterium]